MLLIDQARFMVQAGVFKFFNGVGAIAKPEKANIEIAGFNLFQVGLANRFWACACVFFPEPAVHLVMRKSSLNGASLLNEFLHFAANEKRKGLIGCHALYLPFRNK